MNLLRWIDKRKNWWKVFVVILAVSVSVVGYIGVKTYQYAPPISDFVDERGSVVFPGESITEGQLVFFQKGLMDYGSYLGDGGLRGPDFSAEALHLTARWMNEYYTQRAEKPAGELGAREAKLAAHTIQGRVQLELKENRFAPAGADPGRGVQGRVTMNDAQVFAFGRLVEHYTQFFGSGGPLVGEHSFRPANYITDAQELRSLSAFFFWGGWLCATQRPGYEYSYTHNWPHDPLAGNLPHGGLVFWSIIGSLILILSLGVVFYLYGKLDRETLLDGSKAKLAPLSTSDLVERFRPTPSQRATYKYFAYAAILFLLQILAGLLTISDFVNVFQSWGIRIDRLIPVTVARAWHTQVSVLWIAVCWFGATIWVLPLICRPEPRGQLRWVNGLYWSLVVVGVGTVVGVLLGVHGLLGGLWRWLGIQGWEYMQMGRLFQYVLYGAFVAWLVIVTRGVWPALRQKATWSLPNWMVYAIAGMIFMFSAGFVAGPETNFVIADFWRWCTIHMWVEAFFELFTTIIVAYFLYLMGFVSHAVAARVVYLGAVLFLGSGLIGISHNFYWNAKSIETIALGGVLSTLQVVPLVLLTLDAWRFRNLPQSLLGQLKSGNGEKTTFGLGEAFLFLVGVNFWNFMGAGVFGFTINLPIVNYYQHGTYLTINHGHAALFGVYGNLAIAAMLFCGRWLLTPDAWNPRLLRSTFWAMNIGLVLMVVLDLFPVGLDQLVQAMTIGYAYSRSQEYIQGSFFQTLTWMRGIGVAIFVFGGVLPLTWFMVSRWARLKLAQSAEEAYVVPPSVLAVADPLAAGASHGGWENVSGNGDGNGGDRAAVAAAGSSNLEV